MHWSLRYVKVGWLAGHINDRLPHFRLDIYADRTGEVGEVGQVALSLPSVPLDIRTHERNAQRAKLSKGLFR